MKVKKLKEYIMKKIVFAIVLVLTIGLRASAQDGFFRSGGDNMDRTVSDQTPALPQGSVGEKNDDQPAPLGSGLLVLTALGAGYAVLRKKS